VDASVGSVGPAPIKRDPKGTAALGAPTPKMGPTDEAEVLKRLQKIRVPSLRLLFQHQNLAIEDEGEARSQLAAEMVLNALEGRAPRLERSNDRELKVAEILRSSIYQFFLIAVIICHCGLVIWEPPSTFISSWDDKIAGVSFNETFFLSFEFILVLIYLGDILLENYAVGYRSFADKKWNIGYMVISLLMLAEIVVSLIVRRWVWIRFSRPFRATLLVCKSPRVRRMTSRILRAVPRTIKVMFCALIVAAFYALVGMYLFNGVFDTDANTHLNQNYDSFLASLLCMLVLNTTENFPDVYLLAYDSSPWISSFFFVSYIVIGTWLFLNLIMAVIYNLFEEEHIHKVSRERIKEQQNLLLAFRVLNGDSNNLSYQKFIQMFRYVRPRADEGEGRVIFTLLDKDRSEYVTIREFLLLGEVLNFYSISRVQLQIASYYDSRRWQRFVNLFTNPHPRVRYLVSSSVFRWFQFVNVFGSCVVLLFFVNMDEAADMLNNLFLGLLSLEFFLCIIAHGYRVYWEKDPFTFLLVVVSIVAELAFPPIVTACVRAARILRPLFISRRLRLMITTLSQTSVIIFELLSLMLIVFYVFAVSGMELFSAQLLQIPPHDYMESFDTFPKAMLSLFQISTTNNWQEVMYPAVDDTTIYHSVFFLVFYYTNCMVILNILATLIISAYSSIIQNMSYDTPVADDVKVFRVVLLTGEVEYWRVRYDNHYSRDLLKDELPVFNDVELHELSRRLHQIEKRLRYKMHAHSLDTPILDNPNIQ
jgi:hypothetical protein